MPSSRDRSRSLLVILLLFATVFAVFSPVLRNEFVNFDDQTEIYQNPDFNPVTLSGLAWNWRHTRMTLYMPVTYAAWGAVAAVAPRDVHGVLLAWPFHMLNLALHAACASLVYLLLRRLGAALVPAMLGAIVFAVHPIQTEAVAWASGMYTLLGAMLSLAALLAYIEAVDPTQTRARRRVMYVLATALYAVALLSKPAMAMTPLVAAAVDLVILRRQPRAVAVAMLPWLVLAAATVMAARWFQSASQIVHVTWPARVLVAFDAIGFYVSKLFWPVWLVPDYGRNPNWVANHTAAAVVSAAAALLLIGVAIWASRRRHTWLAAGIAIFVVGVLPYLGLVPFDFQPITTVSDRYAYFGMVGVAMIVTAAGGVATAWRRQLLQTAMVTAILTSAALTLTQSCRWRDTQRLFAHTLIVNPDSVLAHYILGFEARHQGQLAVAEAHYQRALQVSPENAGVRFNLGNIYLDTGRPAEAAIEYEWAIRGLPTNPAFHQNYGVALARLGRTDKAAVEFQKAKALARE